MPSRATRRAISTTRVPERPSTARDLLDTTRPAGSAATLEAATEVDRYALRNRIPATSRTSPHR